MNREQIYHVDLDIWHKETKRVDIPEQRLDVLDSFRRADSYDGVSQPIPQSSDSVQVGTNATSQDQRSAAIGAESLAAYKGTSVGYTARARGKASVAIGSNSRVEAADGIAVGGAANVQGRSSVVVGTRSAAKHNDVIIVGNDLVSSEDGEILIGPRFRVNSAGDIYIDGDNISEKLVNIESLPFNGILGDGRHGAISITTNQTASHIIWQTTSLEITAGDTWTAQSLNPGGFVIACQGRVTIAGTLTVSGRGARGVTGAGAVVGPSGYSGFYWGGSGGGGGGGSTRTGGMGGPIKAGEMIGGYNAGGISPATVNTQWDQDTTAATSGIVQGYSGIYYVPAVFGGALNTGGSNGGSIAITESDMFKTLWALHRNKLWGWGSSGGAGGQGSAGNGGNSGAGGGYIIIVCEELDFTGTIDASGAAGASGGANSGGGGGGGGGMVIIGYRTLIANSGTINVAGGAGGAGSGSGGAGGNGGAGYSNVFDMRI